MHILQCMGSKFCVKFQRAPLKFHTKFWTHTSQNLHLIGFNFCVWLKISLNCDVISLSETGPRYASVAIWFCAVSVQVSHCYLICVVNTRAYGLRLIIYTQKNYTTYTNETNNKYKTAYNKIFNIPITKITKFYTLKMENCHDATIVITDSATGCCY